MNNNIKYAVIGGLFGMSSANIYAASSEAASVCNQMNESAPEKQLFAVKKYERVVTCAPGDRRYKRRRHRISDMIPTNPQPPTSGAPCMIVRKQKPSVTFLKAA
ncbi:MAG: hypothetical protein K6A67_11385 [Bacteroidales bacterium]|nr:hypothetical protein [Bacteroidales bacterium]